ncbi:TetR/AcrR family transcriptional regulator [Xanthomonas massiliensis]|jgi:AcrR family transcriptional regulator|uniref:TetR/AcrR family transcriptional regulator n=1 Tax=Xanthomonas massiliensis TaxID=1720302 RepID=UPI000826651D|nr:TetR/AcrR family transcriptional regulator [Xanthomonas massiliensis]
MVYKRSGLMERRLADNRQRILKAARRLVGSEGFRGAPVAAVAAAAGVSTGLIYRHFPSKAELFVEVLDAAIAAEIAILQDIAAGPQPVAERLGLAVASFVRRALAGPALAWAFIAEPVDAEVDAARIRGRRRFGAVFKALLDEGVAAGAFPAQDTEVAAACLVGAFTEALVGPTAPQWQRRGDPEILVGAIRATCLRLAGAADEAAVREGARAVPAAGQG